LACGATCVAEVTSRPDDDDYWQATAAYTALSLWWIDDESRPWFAVVEGLIGPAATPDMVDRFRAVAYGTMARALNSFDPSNLRDDLVDAIPGDAADVYPDSNAIRAQRARGRRGYQGADENMEQAVGWLYDEGGEDMLPTHLARSLEADFGVPFRTGYNAVAGGALTGWPKAFIGALRYFDRGAWRQSRREAEKEQSDAV